ncbi:MAG: DUF4136 domain-containing protein [Saprospiraceae bacterium]
MKHPVFALSALFVLALLAGSCSPFAKVYAEEEPGVNLYRYRTFGWLDMTNMHVGADRPAWLTSKSEAKIRASVEGQMSRYGFKPCTEKPDLVLHYHVVVKNEVLYVRDWWCDEDANNRHAQCHRVHPVNYQEGTLILDFIDAATGNQVWRGAAIGGLENLTPEAAETRIEQAVQAIFKKFPEQPIPGVASKS